MTEQEAARFVELTEKHWKAMDQQGNRRLHCSRREGEDVVSYAIRVVQMERSCFLALRKKALQ